MEKLENVLPKKKLITLQALLETQEVKELLKDTIN